MVCLFFCLSLIKSIDLCSEEKCWLIKNNLSHFERCQQFLLLVYSQLFVSFSRTGMHTSVCWFKFMSVSFHILWFKIYIYIKEPNCGKFKHQKGWSDSSTGCQVSILGEVQNPTGHCPGQPALDNLVLSRGVGLGTSMF